MASLIQWTGVWVSSRSRWWTGKPGILQSLGSQRVRHDWVTELNWTAADYVWAWTKSSSFHTTGFKYRQDKHICLCPASVFLWGRAGPMGYTEEDPIGSLISRSSLVGAASQRLYLRRRQGAFPPSLPSQHCSLLLPSSLAWLQPRDKETGKPEVISYLWVFTLSPPSLKLLWKE